MPRPSPDQYDGNSAELTQEERELLDKFETKLKLFESHLSLAKIQPTDWKNMGVEILYGNNVSFRYVTTFDEIKRIANAEVLPELFVSTIRAHLDELRKQQSAVVESRNRYQQA